MLIEDILADRGSKYGPFIDNAVIAQGLKDVMRQAPGWSKLRADQQEALELNAMKISRILSGDPDYIDNWADIAGYSTLIVKALKGAEAARDVAKTIGKGGK